MGEDRRETIGRLRQDAERLAARFDVRYRAIEPERANVRRRYGICYSDGTIRIRLHHAVTRKPLKYSSLVNTLCHELAHLRHFNHGPRFEAFYACILDHARRTGIYRPGPERALARREEKPEDRGSKRPAPIQLALFDVIPSAGAGSAGRIPRGYWAPR